jgi:hypothetical protein
MIKVIDQPSVLDYLPRLEYQEMSIEEARLIEGLDGTTYIFLDDYITLVESGRENLIYTHYHIDPSKLGFIVDEARLINHPHYLKNRKKYVKNTKVSIRPLNTRHHTKLIEEAIAFYEQYHDFTLFDQFVNEDNIDFVKDVAFSTAADVLKKKIPQVMEQKKQEAKDDLKKTAKRGAMLAGALYLGKKAADYYADNDARKPKEQRSSLIAKLRVLKGKQAEYESKYEKAEYNKKGIIGKIIWKIKAAIKKILSKLKSMISRET